jgi:hypothetical protein
VGHDHGNHSEHSDHALSVMSPRAQLMARTMAVDVATADVIRALQAAGIRSILLKGPALARWLYDDRALRPYVDCDLLVSPADLEGAEQVLQDLGFAPGPLDTIAGDWPRHARTWLATRRANVDLHRTFPGIGAPAEQLWAELSARTELMSIAGADAEVLDPAGRALIVALHAAKDGTRVPKVHHDLGHAVDRVSFEVWAEAAELASRLQAEGAFAAGLRMSPDGEVIAQRLELTHDRPTLVALRSRPVPPLAVGLNWLLDEPSWRRRLVVVARKVVPPRAYLREWHPLARRGRVGLIAAYAWRPFWMLWRTGPAIRSLTRARRQVRAESPSPTPRRGV